VAHLEHITQQDQAVGPAERVKQRRSLRRATQHVDAAEPPQVQV
jgi:hypothetical protein